MGPSAPDTVQRHLLWAEDSAEVVPPGKPFYDFYNCHSTYFCQYDSGIIYYVVYLN